VCPRKEGYKGRRRSIKDRLAKIFAVASDRCSVCEGTGRVCSCCYTPRVHRHFTKEQGTVPCKCIFYHPRDRESLSELDAIEYYLLRIMQDNFDEEGFFEIVRSFGGLCG